MLDTIPGWECLRKDSSIENGKPWQYVAFSVMGAIRGPFNESIHPAIATIGQRDGEGRLYQSWSLEHPHFAPRKITVTSDFAETQLKVIRMVTQMMNDKRISPDSIPAKVSTNRAWIAIVELLKVSGDADNA